MKLAYTLSLLIFVTAGCGPGVTDGEFSIANGYFFSDAGGNGKMILYRQGDGFGKVVVSVRVDGYVMDGKKLIVARRPAETVVRDGISDWKFSEVCEYWMIDTETHAVQKIIDTNRWPKLQCDPPVTY